MKQRRIRSQSKIIGYNALGLDKDDKIQSLSKEIFTTKPLCLDYIKSKKQEVIIYEEIQVTHTVYVYE